MDQNKAKAIFAIIMALTILVVAYSLFQNDTMKHIYGQTVAPNHQPELIQEPTQPGEQTPTPVAISTGGGNSDSNPPSTPQPPPVPVAIATFEGFWGIIATPQPFSDITGTLYTDETQEQYTNSQITLSGSYQGKAIYITFSLEQTSFSGTISFDQYYSDNDPITGSIWKSTLVDPARGQIYLVFFTWGDSRYWIVGFYDSLEDDNSERQITTIPSAFHGFWGDVSTPEPLSKLYGMINSISTSNVDIGPHYLSLSGKYYEREIKIVFPLEDPMYKGWLWFTPPGSYHHGIWVSSVDTYEMPIEGSLWHDGDSKLFLSFFKWDENQYWICGQL